jgi:hypothetical protein
VYLPYFCPWPQLRPEVKLPRWEDRRPAILSMGGNFDPSGIANFNHFDLMSGQLSIRMQEPWSYLLTWWSQWHEAVPQVSAHIEIERNCEQPWDLLCETRALAVLTHLGFGFKTTVVDGLAAGCHVIVHPRLAERLPKEVSALCLLCDPHKEGDVARLATALAKPPARHRLNEDLCQRAADTLKASLSSSRA